MLSAFTARSIVELKPRDKSKIESILAYGDRVLVGLNTGSLRIYRVHESTESNESSTGQDSPKAARKVELLREEEKFSRRPIQQLATIKEANVLVSLSDNYVSIHDLQSYTLQEKLEKTKGATSFAITSNIVKDDETGIPSIVSKLAVAVKRKVLLWSWEEMELSSDTLELSLPSTVKSLHWASGQKLIVGTDPGFTLIDSDTHEAKDILKPGTAGEAVGQAGTRFGAVNSSGMSYVGMGGWVPKPMATRLSEGQLLLARDVNTLFIDNQGEALDKRQVPWAQAPEAVGYSYPYLLALQPPAKGTLEIRNPETLHLLQSIQLANASMLHVPRPNISLAHAGKGFLVANDRCVWRMSALGYEEQIDELVDAQRYDEAVSLLSMLEDTLLRNKHGRIREIKMRKAKVLFEHRKYRDALDLFSEASAPPIKVIALYPHSIAGSLSSIQQQPTTESMVSTQLSETTATESDKPSKSEVESERSSYLPGMLRSRHIRGDSDTASIKSARSEAGVAGGGKTTEEKALEGRDLKIAVNELCAFLAQTRTRLQRYLNFDETLKEPLPKTHDGGIDVEKVPFADLVVLEDGKEKEVDWHEEILQVARLADTTLFRAYMLARPGLASSLFRLDNFCDPTVVREKLYESGRYSELIDFLQGKRLHREALELLQKFGKNEADEDVIPQLRGPQRTVTYLQQLPPDLIDLILEFISWPIKTDAEQGMQVFLADTETAETLPRERVLAYLRSVSKRLVVRYLEHLINEWNDATPQFHQQLVDLYLQKLKAGDFDHDTERWTLQKKLTTFLQSSTQYDFATTIDELPENDEQFYEMRALVLRNLNRHRDALIIYVFQLKDHERAEQYCNEVYLSTHMQDTTNTAAPIDDDEDDSLYHTLLSLYLTPPSPYDKDPGPQWPPALSLLSHHGSRLSSSTVLSLLPSGTKLEEVEQYFTKQLRATLSTLRQSTLAVGLWNASVDDAKGLALRARTRPITVRRNDHCSVCGKRFGTSAIRVLPSDGTVEGGVKVVHYGCFDPDASATTTTTAGQRPGTLSRKGTATSTTGTLGAEAALEGTSPTWGRRRTGVFG